MSYDFILVQSVRTKEKGKNEYIHIKPLPNQEPYLDTMHVECSKDLINDYPPGTKFRIKAKITSRNNSSRRFIYTNYNWSYEVIKD